MVDHRSVQADVIRLHGNRQDLTDGDLLHRLDRFDAFVKGSISIADIDLAEFNIGEDKVLAFMEMYRTTGTYPPVVFDAVDRSMIDGSHRANALCRLGLKEVDALIGVAEHLDADWQALEHEDIDDDH